MVFFRGAVVDLDRLMGFGLGSIFSAVVERSLSMAWLAAMFSRRLRSKALISGFSFFTGAIVVFDRLMRNWM